MAEQRLPKVNQDDGTWGDILRQYLKKEHTDDGTDNAANGGHQHITITASDGTAGTAPIRLTSGTLLSVAAIGAIEFNNDTLYFTKTTGTTRMQVVMDTATQTLTNKTLTSPTISAPTFSGSYSFGGTPTWPTFNQSTTGSAATLTTSRTFQTNLASTSTASFNGSANVTPGVTGTLPVANGGTGRATSTTPYGLIAAGTGATTAQQTIAPGTAGQFLKSAGASALASFAGITQADVANLTTDLAAKAADNTVVKLTGNQTIAGDKTFTDVASFDDITYTKEIRISPTNGTPQSAAFTLDNDNGQVWQNTNNSAGHWALWDSNYSKAPIAVAPNATDQTLYIDDELNINATTDMHNHRIYNVSDPISAQDAVTKNYVDNNTVPTADNGVLFKGGGTSLNTVAPEVWEFTHIPHLFNDIAFNNLRGGSVVTRLNGSPVVASDAANLFSPDTSPCQLYVANASDVWQIEVTMWRGFDWTAQFGIVQHPGFRAKDIVFERYNATSASWTTVETVADQTTGIYRIAEGGWGGTNSVTKLRFTLSDFTVSPGDSIRVTNIFALAYDSSLLSGSFLSLGGGSLFGHISDSSNPTSADHLARKGYVDSAAASIPKYDGNLIIGGNFQNDANWANAWGTQTTAQAVHTGEKSHQIVSTGAGAGTDYLSLTHDGTGTPALMPAVAERRYAVQIWLRKKSTNVGGGNLLFQTVRTKFDNSVATITSSYSASTDISNSQWLYFETTHTVSAGDDKYHQFRVALDSGVPAGDTFYVGGVFVSDLTGGFTTYTFDTLENKRITPRTMTPSVAASYTIDIDDVDFYSVTGQNQNVTFNNPTGTPDDGQKLMVRIKDDGTPRLVGWGSNFQASGITGPIAQTVPNKEHNVLFVYSAGVSKWVCLAADTVGY